MTKLSLIFVFFLALNCLPSNAQNISTLKDDINNVLTDKEATIAVSILGMNPNDTISINGSKHLPMQSVYKYHLAIVVLHQVNQGILNLNDTIEVKKEHLAVPYWSIIRKKYPNGGYLTLKDILKYTVANSDNIGCDILFDLVGGPAIVNNYFHEIGISDISIKHNEESIQGDWELQYKNWTTANAANKALKLFFENKKHYLSTNCYDYLWAVMRKSWQGKISMKTHLPKNTVIAHKTGHSGKNSKGLTGAQNDIGIIFLPNREYFYLSVLISNSNEAAEVNKKIIADIAQLAYSYFDSLYINPK